MRTIGVVTVARSDYGIYRPLLRAIEGDPKLQLHLIVGGMHLVPEFGYTVEDIERDGFAIADRVEMLLASDTPFGTAKSMGVGVMAFAESYARSKLDILVVLGDRFEMHAAALAALPIGIPIAHVHGGEVTEGAIDDALRHGITKIAHLHFTATQEYADRVMRMGEEPWRVVVSGAPSLDNLDDVELVGAKRLQEQLGVPLGPDTLLVTFHPVTRELDRTSQQIDALLRALERSHRPAILTLPNADAHGRLIASRIHAYADSHPEAHVVPNLGTVGYFSVMATAAAMVGNSSSGIIEAASFRLPVVNVGRRQAGRTRAANVVDVAEDENPEAILQAIERAIDPTFRASLDGMSNPYRHGSASSIIAAGLRDTPIDRRLLLKRFHDG